MNWEGLCIKGEYKSSFLFDRQFDKFRRDHDRPTSEVERMVDALISRRQLYDPLTSYTRRKYILHSIDAPQIRMLLLFDGYERLT